MARAARRSTDAAVALGWLSQGGGLGVRDEAEEGKFLPHFAAESEIVYVTRAGRFRQERQKGRAADIARA